MRTLSCPFSKAFLDSFLYPPTHSMERERRALDAREQQDGDRARDHHRRSSSPVAVRRRELSGDLSTDGEQRAKHDASAYDHEHERARAGAGGGRGEKPEGGAGRSAAAGLAQLALDEQNFPQLGEFGLASEPARAAGASQAKSVLVGHHNFPQLGEFGFGEDSTSGAMCGSPAMSVGGGRTAGYCAAHYPSLQT